MSKFGNLTFSQHLHASATQLELIEALQSVLHLVKFNVSLKALGFSTFFQFRTNLS